MTSIQEFQDLHHQAMSRVEDAFFARRRGDMDLLKQKYREASPWKKKSPCTRKKKAFGEPAESALQWNTATIALNSGMCQNAEKLADLG